MSQALFEAGVCVFPSRRGLEIFLDLLHLLHIFSLNKACRTVCLSERATADRRSRQSGSRSVRLRSSLDACTGGPLDIGDKDSSRRYSSRPEVAAINAAHRAGFLALSRTNNFFEVQS